VFLSSKNIFSDSQNPKNITFAARFKKRGISSEIIMGH
jgi:hypothetical protein